MDSICDAESFENCFRIKFKENGSTNGGGGTRSKIRGLSKGSRRRLVFLINQVPSIEEAFFVTLTMREASEDFKQWKSWLNRIKASLRKSYPLMSGLWRLEFQKRGTPHFHLLLFPNTNGDLQLLRNKISKYWMNAVGRDNVDLDRGISVERIRDMKKSGFYLAIYQAKDEQDRKDIPTGRLWGFINKKNFPVAKYQGSEVQDFEELIWCKRIYRRYIKANGACTSSPLFRSLRTRANGFRGFMSRPSQRKFFALCKTIQKDDYFRFNVEYHGSDYWNWIYPQIIKRYEARKVA